MKSRAFLAVPMLVVTFALSLPVGAQQAKTDLSSLEVGKETLLIQGFEADDIFAKKDKISYLSGVPETSEVEFWDMALYNRTRFEPDKSGIACKLTDKAKTEGKSALEAKFTRGDRALRVSLKNNLDQPGPDRPQANALGFWDQLKGDITNLGDKPVTVEIRLQGGYSLTDRSLPLCVLKTVELKPGKNEFAFSAEQASAHLADPHDAAAVEFTVPAAAEGKEVRLLLDNIRMERQTLPKILTDNTRCIDFGVKYYVWPGMTDGMQLYDAKSGFGFSGTVPHGHGGDMHVFNDLLTRDGFVAPAAFRLDLPNGKYTCVMMHGNYWGRPDVDRNIEIKANGKVAWSQKMMTAAEKRKFKFANENCDHWKAEMDLWNMYEEESYFKTISFPVEVTEGKLELDFSLPDNAARTGGENVWNYLIAIPSDKEAQVKPGLEWLSEKVRREYSKVFHADFGRDFALYNHEEVICAEEYMYPDIAKARKAVLEENYGRGLDRQFVPFMRDIHDLLTPHSVPRLDEIRNEIHLFAAPGQTVQWSVGVYPLRDLKGVMATCGDFAAKDGGAGIPASAIENWLVSYRPTTPVTSAHAEPFHYVGPGVLLPAKPTDMPREYPRQFWMATKLPDNLPAGLYKARVVIAIEGKNAGRVEVLLRVLPFKLDEPAGVTFAIAFNATRSFWEPAPANPPVRPAAGEKPAKLPPTTGKFPEMEFWRSMGLNTIWFGGGADYLEDMQMVAGKVGMNVEPASGKYANWRWPHEYKEYMIKAMQKKGTPVSFQPTHTGYREGRRVRFSTGFWLWRSGIRHRVLQWQPNAAERVYYAHCGHAKFGPATYLFPSMQGEGLLLPGPAWWDVRDGITDWRYIQTLEDLVKAKGTDSPADKASVAAKECLAELTADLNPNLDYYYFKRKRDFNHVDRFGLTDNVWTGRRYMMERWELANRIAAFGGANIAGQAKPLPDGPGQKLILHSEYFGPLWVDESQYMDFISDKPAMPRLLAETPKAPVGQDWVTVLALVSRPSESDWTVVLKDSAGKELSRQAVGKLPRWKTRWLIHTSNLPAGKYTLELAPADGKAEGNPITATIQVLPAVV